ncbi:sulfate transporter family protein [Chelativorans sp. YIM 93263]|uniref:sulfate transporter family protein n=1 Tax=Chelativorans sp. YIM 93263 TaxID=2906648 RepID=UPI0023796ECB|nr:sulfate transporter family protein [Chelativorans sp. YIM 93263]
MILEAARAAASQLFLPAFRKALYKTLGLTLVILAGIWVATSALFDAYAMPWLESLLPGLPSWAGWLGFIAAIAAGLGLALALALLIAPVTAIVAGIFLDEVAETVERESYPQDPPGEAVPFFPAMIMALKFLGVIIIGNIFALLLLLVPGVNLIAFFIVNAYLLGREFFEFAAMRFRGESEAKALRRRYAGTVFVAGFVVAGFLAVPFLNLLTPLFAAAMMVHLYKSISAREASA